MLAGVEIGEVDLDQRLLQGSHRIQQRHRRVAEPGGIKDNAGGLPAGLLQPVDQLALVVGLAEDGGEPGPLGPAIDRGRPAAQEIEVRAIEDIYGLAAWGFPGQGNSGEGIGWAPYTGPSRPRKPHFGNWPYGLACDHQWRKPPVRSAPDGAGAVGAARPRPGQDRGRTQSRDRAPLALSRGYGARG